MAFDTHTNLAQSTVAVAPVPATTGLSLTVAAGTGASFGAAPFNCTVWPGAAFTVPPTQANAEIVRVTAVVGDVFTIQRAQEGSAAMPIAAGWQISQTVTAKSFKDLEALLPAIQFVSGGTTFASGPGGVSFQDGNGITFGVNGSTVTASVNTGNALVFSAKANSRSTGTVEFSSGPGMVWDVIFGMNPAGLVTGQVVEPTFTADGAITISVLGSTYHFSVNPQSTQPVAASASNGSFTFQTLGFSNANGITFGTSAGSIVTASYTVPSTAGLISAINFSAGTTTNNLTRIVFSNLNGVSFGLNGSTITASVAVATTQGSIVLSAGLVSNLGSKFTFADSNGISFGMNNSTITASVATSLTAINLSASTNSANGSAFVFSAGSNVGFDLVGSTINASAIIGIQAGTTKGAFSSFSFVDSNGISFGISSNSITATIATSLTNIRVSAGTTSNNLSAITFSNNPAISFGLNGSVVTASSPMLSYWELPIYPNNTSTISAGQNTVLFDPLILPCPISFTGVNMLASINMSGFSSTASFTGQQGYTRSMALYSRSVTNSAATNFSNSSNLVSFFSSSWTLSGFMSGSSQSMTATYGWGTGSTNGSSSVTFSTNATGLTNASFTGFKVVGIGFATSLSAGEYWIAQANSSSTAGAGSPVSIFGLSQYMGIQATGMSVGQFGQASNSSDGIIPGLGAYSVTSGAFPSSFAFNQISKETAMRRRHMVFQA